MEKYGTARQTTDDNIIRRMRCACWITKATDTHSRYLMLFSQQQWLRARGSMLHYTHIAHLVITLFTYNVGQSQSYVPPRPNSPLRPTHHLAQLTTSHSFSLPSTVLRNCRLMQVQQVQQQQWSPPRPDSTPPCLTVTMRGCPTILLPITIACDMLLVLQHRATPTCNMAADVCDVITVTEGIQRRRLR